VVWTDATLADFDLEAFHRDVRAGRMVGTNGPIIDARIRSGTHTTGPGLAPITPASDAVLDVTVRAAPWVPVDEVRIVINGVVVRRLSDLPAPADPFGTDGTMRLEASMPIAELLPSTSSDAWLVVEAGARLLPTADLSCDGIPDTGDNDGNGVIDARDVDTDATSDTPAHAIAEVVLDRCIEDVGPMRDPPAPREDEAELRTFWIVTSGASPAAFTNPFLLDLDGGAFEGPVR
jgi:hypothetical protein